MIVRIGILVMLLGLAPIFVHAEKRPFKNQDFFNLEYASDIRISPNGKHIVYVRRGFDVMNDRGRSGLWLLSVDGRIHEPITQQADRAHTPRWSPDGQKIAYIAAKGKKSQLHVRWMKSGNLINVTHLADAPGNIVWSPDGQRLTFSQFVPDQPLKIGKLPVKPKGAEWAEDARVFDDLLYKSDGGGFGKPGNKQIFVVSMAGGSPRQLTTEAYNHNSSVSWAKDGQSIYYSANYDPDWQRNTQNSEIYQLNLASGKTKQITTRRGQDGAPKVSRDGKSLMFLGADEDRRYRVTQIYVTDIENFSPRSLTENLDRSVNAATWSKSGKYIYFSYTDQASTNIARVDMKGNIKEVVAGIGGNAIGRPYSSGSFSLSNKNGLAYTVGSTNSPANVALYSGNNVHVLTAFNEILLEAVEMASVEEFKFSSSHDELEIQSWIVKPPEFDPTRKYPLILEIHGGPYASYAAEFSAEIQLYAAAGYVVLYVNPRGSTSYGEAFANEIYQAYPGNDYDDLMSGVDGVIAKGYIDRDNLFVTGGSGGGVLTAWIVGKTDRFKAAVSAKPVINWYSHTLTADIGSFFWKINFDKLPWEDPMTYHRLSPISLVANVKTPTMLLTGEVDYRTPMSESEQYYQALKILGVDSMLVRIPGASHSITRRPSNLLRKAAYVLGWFDRYRTVPATE